MKGYMIAILFVFGLEIGLMAQADRFFKRDNDADYMNDTRFEMILLPNQHGLDYDYYAEDAPLESGCLLLLGMAMMYAKFKKQNNRSLM